VRTFWQALNIHKNDAVTRFNNAFVEIFYVQVYCTTQQKKSAIAINNK
jgi:hypothetical protein